MFETLISFALATSILAISPGPDNIFVLTQSIVNGKKYGFATVFGLMTGCIIHTTLVAFGVSAIIKSHENLFFLVVGDGTEFLRIQEWFFKTKPLCTVCQNCKKAKSK